MRSAFTLWYGCFLILFSTGCSNFMNEYAHDLPVVDTSLHGSFFIENNFPFIYTVTATLNDMEFSGGVRHQDHPCRIP